ncbi:MAG TPA: ribosome maturation factor RimM [Acidimicrobiales bacterium]|nr:ribosome maturation factor RimM [Acidimicrobiales bacterium]
MGRRLELGRIGRPHGLSGEVVVHLVSNRPERLEPGARLGVREEPGRDLPTELVVVSARSHRHGHLLRFAGVDDREAAGALTGAVLEGDPIDDPEALFVHELVGAEVVDLAGEVRGRVTALEANPASDLLVVDDRYLVPLRFVVARTGGRVVVEVPEGLFE